MKRLIIAASIAAASIGAAHATTFGGYNGDRSDYPNMTRYGDGYAFATQRVYSYQNFPEWHAANGTLNTRAARGNTGDPVNPGGSSTQRLSETTGPASTMNSPQNGHMTPAPGYTSSGNTASSGSAMGSGSTAAGTAAGSMGSTSGMGGAANMGGSATQRQSETTGPASTLNSPQNGHMTPAPGSTSSSTMGTTGTRSMDSTVGGSTAAGTAAGAAASGATNMGGSSTQRQSQTTGPASTMQTAV